jgi:MOSC domain-containing protein YiiM
MHEPTSRVFQINQSAGGVPKLAAARAEVSVLGLRGDQQANREVHGGPERAVCLYSLERLLALQAEGHPVFPGAMGENLTLSGLDWQQVTPGSRLWLGAEVEIEITRYTSPCKTITAAFLDGDFNRVSQKIHPGWSRVYARVLRPGIVQVGAPVWLQAGS